jgi:hypothetical protein
MVSLSACAVNAGAIMPDKKGYLTKEEREKALKWITDHRKGPCPCCGHADLSLTDVMAGMPLSAVNDGLILNSHVPSVILACPNCGQMQFFSIVRMGLAEPAQIEERKSVEGSDNG